MYNLCKALARTSDGSRFGVEQRNLRELIPPQDVTEKLVHAYLRTFETVTRVLHVPTFLAEFHDYFTNPYAQTDAFLVTLMAVMAIGVGFCPDVSGWGAAAWIQTVQAWVDSSVSRKATVADVQIACLLLLARQSSNVDWESANLHVGALVQKAMQLGLHIDPSLLPGLSFYAQETRRRL